MSDTSKFPKQCIALLDDQELRELSLKLFGDLY